jgi:hypothetical protein
LEGDSDEGEAKERNLVLMDRPVDDAPRDFIDGRKIKIPPNVWFVGTANHDETTLEFADKTYDRAHVLELPHEPPKDIPGLGYVQPSRLRFSDMQDAFAAALKNHGKQAEMAKEFFLDHVEPVLGEQFGIGIGNRLKKRQLGQFIPVFLATGGSVGDAIDHLLVTRALRRTAGLHDIFDNDPHYQEVAELWRAWHESGESKEQDEEAIFNAWQKANLDFSAYCRLLVCRAMRDIGWKPNAKGHSHSDKSLSFVGPDGHEARLEEVEDLTYWVKSKGAKLKIVPLLATLARVTEEGQLQDWLDELDSAVEDADTLFLYFGKSSELQNIMLSHPRLGMRLDGLTHGPLTHDLMSSFVPVSPFEITSLEKVGRHLNMWLRGRLLSDFPPKIKAPGALAQLVGLNNVADKLSVDIWSPRRPIDAAYLRQCEGHVLKLSLPDVRRKAGDISSTAIQRMTSDLQAAEKLSYGVLICPVCGQDSADYQFREDKTYVCRCLSRSCGAEWGLRMCKSCHQPYPYLHAQSASALNVSTMEPGWLDRLQGRDCIAIPCAHPASSSGYVCSNCFACAHVPEEGICDACPAFGTVQGPKLAKPRRRH